MEAVMKTIRINQTTLIEVSDERYQLEGEEKIRAKWLAKNELNLNIKNPRHFASYHRSIAKIDKGNTTYYHSIKQCVDAEGIKYHSLYSAFRRKGYYEKDGVLFKPMFQLNNN